MCSLLWTARHTPGRPQQAVAEARAAGFEQVSLDLIYGTPGESDADWQTSLDAALAAEPTHVSAYALIVEEGTRLGAQVRRGEVPMPDDDVLADRYLMAEESLQGLGWYEVSNWGEPCRHNVGYWKGGDWWGAGPGAHSHVGGVRWWNVKHPTAYADRLAHGRSPALAREVLTPTGPAGRAGAAGDPAARGPAAATSSTTQAAGRRAWWTRGCSSGSARARAARC